MRQRVLFLVRTFLTSVVLFLGAKVVFMLTNLGTEKFTAGDMWDVLLHGLTLDLSTTCYLMIVPLLLTVVSIWYVGRWLRWAIRLWFVLVAIMLGLAFAADTALYPHWGFKLDATCLQYLSTPEVAAASVSMGWLLAGLIGLIGLIALIAFIYNWRLRPFAPLGKRWPYGTLCIVMIPLLFLGIRGGIDESTTNIGQVYYSQNAFLNHSAVNPVFSFMASFESTVRDDVRYTFMTDEECNSTLAGVFNTQTLNPDTLLRTQRPNIVVVMMESAGGQFTKIGGKDYIMPHFNRLSDEGVYFSQCYANSFRTDRATVCIWSGHESFPTMSLQKVPKKNANLPGIARSLVKAGYDTHYYYGGDINFTKKRSYLINSGFEQFTYKSDFSRREQRTAQWGVCDSIVFGRIIQHIQTWSQDDEKPHLIGYNTLSSHEPWDVPTKELDDPVENAFHYLDQCIGHFVESLRQLPQWNNLLLILLPDHGVKYGKVDERNPLIMHIPMLWLGGAVRNARVIDVICNQSDLAATLLGQLGIGHDDFLFSRDVLSQTYTRPFAYHTFNNGFTLIDSTQFVVYDLTTDQPMVGSDEGLFQLGKAILQTTSEDLARR